MFTFSGTLGPVLRMAETPLCLFFSRFCRSHWADELENDFLDTMVILVTANAGVRKRGRSSVREGVANIVRVAILVELRREPICCSGGRPQ